jgi:hypothetical protein
MGEMLELRWKLSLDFGADHEFGLVLVLEVGPEVIQVVGQASGLVFGLVIAIFKKTYLENALIVDESGP